MAQNIDLFLDVDTGNLISNGSLASGSFPDLTRNDSYTLRIRLQRLGVDGTYSDIGISGISAKAGIGEIDDGPTSGAFKLAINGITSSAITYNSDEPTLASSIYTAVSNNVSTVTTYGLEPDAFILTATGTNSALSFSGDSFTLFPTTNIQISTRRFPAANVQAQQIVKLRRNPAVYSDTFTQTPSSGIILLTKTQDGSTTANETYRLVVGADAEGGSFVLSYGSNSTTAIPIGSFPVVIQSALSSVTGIGANNISVEAGNANNEYSISFVRSLGNTNITTALSLDAAGVVFGTYLQTTLTMATAELDELFAESGEDEITPTLEVEITQSGTPKTLYQGDVTVRRDLITTGNVVPGAQATYYTKAETDSLFVEDSTTNVDATNRKLKDSGSTDSVDYGNRKLLDGSTEYIRWNDGLGFYGATAVAKPTGSNLVNSVSSLGILSYSTPTQANIINNLVSAGLFSNSSTYGVFPSSPRTLTTTASIYFGQVNSNSTNSVSVVVTGCSINDIVLIGLPSTTNNGLAFSGHVTVADGLEVDCINATNGNITPATATYRITVIGY